MAAGAGRRRAAVHRTGVNVYADYPTELCDREGSFIPFARAAAKRTASGGPRPSLAERYANWDAYALQVRAAADALVAARLRAAEASSLF